MALDLDALATQPVSRNKLDAPALRDQVSLLGDRWSVAGPDLKLAMAAQPMSKAASIATRAAALADELDHHPTMVIEYAGLTLTIHTHDAKAITSLDLIFAARLERWLREQQW